MSTFIGYTEVKGDAKGRIFIPSGYRKLLQQMGCERLVLRRDADNACLVVFPESVWNQKVDQLKAGLDEWNQEDQLLLMQYMAEADWLDMDSQGRVLLSRRHLDEIGAEQDLLIVGMLDRFAIWDRKTYEARKLSTNDLAAKLKERMARF